MRMVKTHSSEHGLAGESNEFIVVGWFQRIRCATLDVLVQNRHAGGLFFPQEDTIIPCGKIDQDTNCMLLLSEPEM